MAQILRDVYQFCNANEGNGFAVFIIVCLSLVVFGVVCSSFANAIGRISRR
jgi:hypothetical protein